MGERGAFKTQSFPESRLHVKWKLRKNTRNGIIREDVVWEKPFLKNTATQLMHDPDVAAAIQDLMHCTLQS